MNRTALLAALGFVAFAVAAGAQQLPAPLPPPGKTVHMDSISKLPASYPHDVPIPQGVRPVSASEHDGALVILFVGPGKAEPMRAAYEEALPKRGWKIEGTDRVGEEQGLFATQGARTLSIFFQEKGPELSIQLAHVPKTPAPAPPAAK